VSSALGDGATLANGGFSGAGATVGDIAVKCPTSAVGVIGGKREAACDSRRTASSAAGVGVTDNVSDVIVLAGLTTGREAMAIVFATGVVLAARFSAGRGVGVLTTGRPGGGAVASTPGLTSGTL
jgi:hypothetical protein